MRVLVTRPLAQAPPWIALLRERGIEAIALPLIDIAAPDDPMQAHAAWAAITGYRLVVFVSPNAVEKFFVLRPGTSWPQGVRCACPGPGTTQSLLQAGVPREQIVEPAAGAARFDSETLWEQLQGEDWQRTKVLCVRGAHGRDWLAERLQGAGAVVETVCVYRSVPPVFGAVERHVLQRSLAEPRQTLWWFSSSLAIDHLQGLAGAAIDWSAAHALATHPRIAARARELGFGEVDEVRPTTAELLHAIERSIQSSAL